MAESLAEMVSFAGAAVGAGGMVDIGVLRECARVCDISEKLVVSASASGLAREILTASGDAWLDSYVSTGGVLTKQGLLAVRDAVYRKMS
ncbi:hypothetical protein VV01_20250 [Luteipulveratus halotolerans]|uniref:Uncharacterized protein n=1 Tax=Luteipulveratus halotolerans TaxID=1631356 RepID=A0A0L6CN10_9MICO|nr:hypothetical protein VV01_20250 [Luteipulveratus halotolerans]